MKGSREIIDLFGYPGVSEEKWLVLGLGDGFKNPEIIDMRVLGFSHKQIEKLLIQLGAE